MKSATAELAVISTFFQALADRANKENDLSDVTYAVCQSDDAFKEFFLKFFFGQKIQTDDIIAFEREHSEDIGRPDFWIETKSGEVFIVEVKIGDENQHFEQYNKLLKKHQHLLGENQAWDHVGYIANYKVTTTEKGKPIDKNCSVHTWHEFKLAIEKSVCRNNLLVTAYVQYLKSICHFYEVKIPDGWRIRGEDFKCFRKLVGEISDAIGKAKGERKDTRGRVQRKWECKVYNSRRSAFHSQWCFGEFFQVMNFDRKGNSILGWFGAYYAEKGVNICVEFEDRQGWGKLVCDKFRQDEKMDDGALRFWIGKKANECVRMDDFFQNVISMVVNDQHLTDKSDDGIECAEVHAKCFKKEVLVIQYLPYVLETQFLSPDFCKMLEEKGYTMELSGEEDQWSYCGKSFALIPVNSDLGKRHLLRHQKIDGWIGVFFRADGWGKNKNARGDSFMDRPTFVVEMDLGFRGKRVLRSIKGVTWYKDDYDYACQDIYIDNDGEEITDVLCKARKVILDAL